jgi:prephenate dehydratase
MGEALAALHRRCDRVRFLGSYPRAGNGASTAAPSTSPLPIGGTDAAQFAAAQKWLDALRAGGVA